MLRLKGIQSVEPKFVEPIAAMKIYLGIALIAGTITAIGCEASGSPEDTSKPAGTAENRFKASDALLETIAAKIADSFETVVVIDHSRLAEKEGVTMPPSVVTIYSKPAIITALMKLNPRVGLDLPQKLLVFEDGGKPAVAYPESTFLSKRHGITDEGALGDYDAALKVGLEGLSKDLLAPVGGDGVTRDYGIVEIDSDFSHAESIERLKAAVMKQGDTVWFGDIDLKAEAVAAGEKLPNATLLLFGGPKPGGVAMAKFPKLGLDAFCQKLLVYEGDGGAVKVIFNDIVAMAKLHYGTSAKPQEVINGRLKETFEGAVKAGGE